MSVDTPQTASTQSTNSGSKANRSFKAKKRRFAPVWLDGQMTVVTRAGKHGEFRVAKLDTGIGEFAVKDKLLEQYDNGVYTGRFLVGLIQAKPSFWKNSVFVEVRAYLDDLIIHMQDELDDAAVQSVDNANTGPAMDPLELERSEAPKSASPALQSAAQVVKPSGEADTAYQQWANEKSVVDVPANESQSQEHLLESLGFMCELDVQEGRMGKDDKGDQIAAIIAREPVALDAKGQDRETLRKQREHLKSLGYRFVSTGQFWELDHGV